MQDGSLKIGRRTVGICAPPHDAGRANTPATGYDTRRGWLAGRKQAAAYLGVSTRTVNRWMNRGAVRYRRLSPKLVMFRPQDLDAAVEQLAQAMDG